MSITLHQLSRRYDDVLALDLPSLSIAPGSFTVITGPPRSGKSTLFRLLVGLETPDTGRIVMDDVDITAESPTQRRLGYVPQSFALYPHIDVRANIAYPLTLARAPKAEIAERVDRAATMLSIGHLLDKTPDQLSGGEKQRTAVARGLLRDASVFLLDDPLVGLDYKLREKLMDDLRQLRDTLDATFIYATSDSVEALTMATELIVLDEGRVVQAGAVETIYHHPVHRRAMELVGFPRANLLPGSIDQGVFRAGPLHCIVDAPDHGAVTAGIRPEAIILGAGGDTTGTVRLVEDLGSEVVVYVDSDATTITAAFAVSAHAIPAIGEHVTLSIDPSDVAIFDTDTGRRLDGPRSGATDG